MKAEIIKILGHYSEEDSKGTVHLYGYNDTFACGLALEDYETKSTKKPITCSTCIDMLLWAKKVSKIKL